MVTRGVGCAAGAVAPSAAKWSRSSRIHVPVVVQTTDGDPSASTNAAGFVGSLNGGSTALATTAGVPNGTLKSVGEPTGMPRRIRWRTVPTTARPVGVSWSVQSVVRNQVKTVAAWYVAER